MYKSHIIRTELSKFNQIKSENTSTYLAENYNTQISLPTQLPIISHNHRLFHP
jgi:hypothetical protein